MTHQLFFLTGHKLKHISKQKMKIHSSAIVLASVLCWTSTHAFVPKSFGGHHRLTSLHVALDPSSTTTKSTIAGLQHAPITLFGKDHAGANASDKHLLGGKGANLAEMSFIGLSVPPGFTISTEVCDQFCNVWNQELPPELWSQVVESLKTIESEMQSTFGSPENPLLLSVRSGAAISMPVSPGECVIFKNTGPTHMSLSSLLALDYLTFLSSRA